MAHVRRGRYWYRTRREGGRVVADYLGAGVVGWLFARFDDDDAAERQRRADAERANRKRHAEIDKAIAEHGRLVRAVTAGVLLTNGYHTHKRQWRKKKL